MLKKVPVTALRPDMFVHELCGSWMDHPFWRSSFRLHSPNDIARLKRSAVREVWIDTAKGPDVPESAAESVTAAGPQDDRQDLIDVAVADPAPPAASPMDVELRRAARICSEGKDAMVAMFTEARMGGAVDLAGAEPLVENIAASVARNPHALVSLARLRSADDYTYMHSVAVCALMVSLGRRLGLDEAALRGVAFAGLLHDLGKAAIPLEVLNKAGTLSDEEFDLVKSHPALGHRMLAEAGGTDEITLDVCLHHHEKLSGRGYPEGLDEARISQFARMGAICDIYDAVTSDRPYKAGWEPSSALMKMHAWCGDHLDRQLFHHFVKCVGIYPVGSLVRLTSDKLAVVTEQHSEALLTPVVKEVYCTRRQCRLPPLARDLAAAGTAERIVDWEDPAKWDLGPLAELWT